MAKSENQKVKTLFVARYFLENSDENWYTLTKKHHMSHSTLHRLKHNMDISTKTVNDLCRILNCRIQDIAEYIPSEDDQTL